MEDKNKKSNKGKKKINSSPNKVVDQSTNNKSKITLLEQDHVANTNEEFSPGPQLTARTKLSDGEGAVENANISSIIEYEPDQQTTNSGEGSSNQDGSTSQNNEDVHNEKRNSSYIYSLVKSIAKNIIKPKENSDDDGETMEIIFRVHLPKFRHGEPVVVGSIEELGNWEKPKVKLKQYKKNVWNYTSSYSYWYSEPIRVPIKRFKEIVEYKYAVSTNNLQFEGIGPRDNRVLEIQRQNFDIWKSNSHHFISKFDYMFLDVIYESATLENIKNAIWDYEFILKRHRELTLSVTNIQFISKHVSDTSIDRNHFLCFLLGHCPNNYGRIELPRDFKSDILLKALFTVDSDTFPKDSWHIVVKGLDLLIHHNISYGLYEWINIFNIARNIDPQYKFIETITFAKCNDDKYIESCFRMLLAREYDENIHEKIIKWLMSQCKNVKILSIVWRSSNREKQLQQNLIECIKKIISSDDPDNLHRNFIELPDDIRDIVSDLFRKRVLDILINGRRVNWNKSRHQSIFNLLNSVNLLHWTKEEYIIVLEMVSNLEDFQLLSVFPSLLANWIEKSKGIDNKVAKICTRWYKKILDIMDRMSHSTDHKGEYVTEVFEKFSNICKLLVNEQSLLDDLMEITINRIRQSSEKLIFSVTSKIDSFSSEVVCAFTKVIKEKIDSMELDRDKYLLKKVQVICGCTDKKSLEIPNEFCETILLLIMSRLQENLNSEVSLHESTEFWIVILRATGSTKRFHSHQFVQEARTTIIELAEIIKNSSIKILPLQELLDLNDDILHFYLNSANYDSEEIITKDILVKVRQNCRFYELSLKKLGDFYKRFCPLQKSKDVQNYLDELIERSNKLNTISLDESLSEAHWSFHKGVISIAKVTYDLNKSQIFYNVFEKRLNEESNDLSVEYIAQTLMKMVLKEYIVKCKHYENWEDLKFSEEIPFWCNVSNFDDELKLMERYSKICINKGKTFMMTIKYLSRNTDWKIRIENLSKIIKVFKIKENWLDNLFDHGNLGIFSNSIETINQKFSKFDKNSWDFIKELSRSEEFLEFLKDKTDDDLKNLINGVDEHSNTRLIQEGTISSLIQIKQFVYPLMNDPNLVMDTLLKEFNYINPSLASKLSLINSNVMAIKNMYKSIYNKVEYTKEKIQNAVNIGIYEFKKEEIDEDCILELSYPYKLETMRFNISELQDLRSRALLISKPGSIGQMDDDIDDMKIKMEEFVNQVDIAQSIIIIMKKLTQLGHFGYREYNESTKGTRNLEKIAKRLRTDLEIWENITNRAQENCYYLTFYPARHVLAFYDYYTENGDQFEIKETCQTLVSFVNRKAKLPPIIGLYCNKDNYDEVLEAINYRLEFIFGTLEKHARPVKNSEERVISDTVKCGELFVAACDDKSKVPNIIMSFYVNHGFYPEPWQLLICMTSTTEEELSIFIKRCFFASKNGYEGHLFCIANLELLDFELQYYLVNKIRFFTEKVEDYNLALICCSETGMHHHIVDQFSKYVHVTDGLSTVAMETIYRELCPKITCVTSELSGQGKTKFIEQESSKNDKNLVSFLISDGVSYNSLIRQLKNSHIQQDNSLHINIISADNPGEVNIFLFQLLTLGMISNNADIISLPDTYIFIEIAGNLLFKSLPFINCLNNMHLVWNIGRLMVPKDIHSPIQIVCHYLDLYDKKELDKKDVIYQSREYNTVKEPLDQVLCQTLLDKYFFKRVDPCILSFRFLEIFVNVLSDQLLRLSGSSFFNVEVLKFMTNHINIRSTLFNTLLDVSNDFAAKSTKTKSAQLQSISNKAAEVDQLENLVHWDDSNHLLVFFLSQSPESISALYRNKNIVPNNVLELLKSQRWELVDYQTLSSDELLTILESLARKTMHIIIYQPYALSADNLLKMALMLLRTRANIPTSLISFLAKVVEVEFDSLNLHAGVTEKAIKDFMTISGKKAATKEIWLFFDEINTCNHIGLLAELIAHRKLDGKSIHSNIRLFAACNPYRIRNKSVSNVGLKPKKIVFEHLKSSLVYEVKPLPDQILDYVWDYGILQSKDEKIYIQIMVQEAKLDPIFAELLFASQNFIRNVEEPYSVSLRDVKRAINLFNFFNKSLLTRQNEKKKYPDNSVEIDTRSYVLALGLCYQSRLYERELRRRYREMMCKIFGNMKETRFNDIIRDEQMDYMKRMHCPPNIAFNEALLENVLAAIVCIMCKIPLFIVGAPVGLAEISPYNPLKVLHSLLEPSYPVECPTVSVIGISNWRLDNSKNSRALLVQRPNFDLVDLVETAACLHIHPDFRCILVLDEKKLKNADPPLLNRFEKQRMSINDILNKGEKELFNQLQEWTWQMSTIAGTAGTKFTINDLFIGFNKEETLQSLIIDIKKKDPMMRDRDILKKCKENLIAIATPDGMVRIERSTLEFEEIQHWKNVYFQVQHHNGIADYFQDLLQGKTVKVNQDGHLVIINTISNINTDCPSIRNEIIMNDELAYKGSFEQHIVNEVTSLMLKKISECKEIVELQLEIRNVLNLCENISNFKRTVSFQLLHFCNDLLSNESIPLEIIKEIIEFRGEEEIFTKIYIHKVFEILRNIKNIEPNKLLCAKQSYVMTSLEIIPFGSPSRLELYQTLFLENPFPLMGQIIKSVFENENKLEHFEFLTWLDNPSKILDSPLFTIINTCLNVKGYHSPIAALFCDVIQKTYFARYDLIELSPYFHCAIEALSNDNVEGLCKVTAIALLKEFVHKFWSTLIQDKILRPVELDYKGFDELINQINHDLSLSFSLVESLKFYFLRDLRDREYSMDDVQKFCLAQKYKLPWLENLPWEFSRLQFNVYYTFKDYNAVDNCFTILLYNNSIEQFDEFLNKISKKEEMSARISLMGGILNRLHIIRATREWKREENQASKLLKEKIGKISHLSNIYKRVVDNVITNRNFILQLDTNVSNSDLLIKSVIGNVIALHSSIPAESSPLAYLLQNLSGCGGSTRALTFMEEPYFIQENTVSSSTSDANNSAE
ncbi:7490_t:CDS:2, partial [Funneliformis geosporum]